MMLLELLTYINAVFTLFFLFWIKFYPNNRALQARVRELEVSFEDMNVSFEASIDDVYDLMDTYIKKWSNRQTTRDVRTSEKDLKDNSPLKTKGIINISELKKNGLIK